MLSLFFVVSLFASSAFADQCAPGSCRAEVVFVLDSSGSIGSNNWLNQVVPFTTGVIDALGGHSHFGIVEFDGDANTLYSLCNAQDDCDAIKNALTSFNYDGGSTDIPDGFREGISHFASCSDASLPNVLVVLTDASGGDPCITSIEDDLVLYGITVYLVKIAGGVNNNAIDCIVDDDQDFIFTVANISDLVGYIDTISDAVCPTCFGLLECSEADGVCDSCPSGEYQFAFDGSYDCASCSIFDDCLSCADHHGCTSCDYEHELSYDEECGLYSCVAESCGSAPTPQPPCAVEFDANGCAAAQCDTNPCECNGDCQFCSVCHNNGCDQCQSGYFKRNYNYPCVSCYEVFGDSCLFCQDFNGCGQCASGYDRRWNSDCGYAECISSGN